MFGSSGAVGASVTGVLSVSDGVATTCSSACVAANVGVVARGSIAGVGSVVIECHTGPGDDSTFSLGSSRAVVACGVSRVAGSGTVFWTMGSGWIWMVAGWTGAGFIDGWSAKKLGLLRSSVIVFGP